MFSMFHVFFKFLRWYHLSVHFWRTNNKFINPFPNISVVISDFAIIIWTWTYEILRCTKQGNLKWHKIQEVILYFHQMTRYLKHYCTMKISKFIFLFTTKKAKVTRRTFFTWKVQYKAATTFLVQIRTLENISEMMNALDIYFSNRKCCYYL